jgi:hypothetical protein
MFAAKFPVQTVVTTTPEPCENSRIPLLRRVRLMLHLRVGLADVHNLAKLLIALNAPVCLWADLCSVLIEHIKFASIRTELLYKKLRTPRESEHWSLAEAAASEDMVRSVLAVAPSEV